MVEAVCGKVWFEEKGGWGSERSHPEFATEVKWPGLCDSPHTLSSLKVPGKPVQSLDPSRAGPIGSIVQKSLLTLVKGRSSSVIRSSLDDV
jgi:hypothetical protein